MPLNPNFLTPGLMARPPQGSQMMTGTQGLPQFSPFRGGTPMGGFPQGQRPLHPVTGLPMTDEEIQQHFGSLSGLAQGQVPWRTFGMVR